MQEKLGFPRHSNRFRDIMASNERRRSYRLAVANYKKARAETKKVRAECKKASRDYKVALKHFHLCAKQAKQAKEAIMCLTGNE